MHPMVKKICVILMALVSPVMPFMIFKESLPVLFNFTDIPEFYAAARLLLEGNGALMYSIPEMAKAQHALFPALERDLIVLYLTPPGVLWLAPMGLIPLDMVVIGWTAFLFLCLVLSLYVLKRLSNLTWVHFLGAFAVACVFGAAVETVRIGQLGSLFLLSYLLGMLALKHERPGLAALPLSFLVAKPQILIPVGLFLLGARRYQAIIWWGGAVILLAVISLFAIGVEGWSNYIELTLHHVNVTMQPELTTTIRGQLLKLIPHGGTPLTVLMGILWLSALGYLVLIARKWADRDEWLTVGLLITMPVGLLFSLYCQFYDYILVLPSLIVFTCKGLPDKFPPLPVLLFILLSMTVFVPFSFWLHYGLVKAGFPINPFVIWAVTYLSMVVWLLRKDDLFDGSMSTEPDATAIDLSDESGEVAKDPDQLPEP